MATSTSGLTANMRGDVGRGLLAGLTPLIRLVVLLAIAVALPVVARLALGAQNFATQQAVAVGTFVVILLIAAVVYAVSLVGVFRRMRVWQKSGRAARATAALWALLITTLIVALPMIIAVLWPQHPAP